MSVFIWGIKTSLMNALDVKNSKKYIFRWVRIILTPTFRSISDIEFLIRYILLWHNLLWKKLSLKIIYADCAPAYLPVRLSDACRLFSLTEISLYVRISITYISREILLLSIFFTTSGAFGTYSYYITPTFYFKPNTW